MKQRLTELLENLQIAFARAMNGDRVEHKDFGVFSLRHRAARPGRNPKTGESIIVAEHQKIRFLAGKLLREVVTETIGIHTV